MSGAVHYTPGAVSELRLDNPARLNCLTPDMLAQIEAHCAAIEADTTARVVLLTATGDRAFCTGADIAAWADLDPAAFARHWVRGGHRVFDRLARLSRPSIAVLTGPAFGGGLELAAACDIRVMAPGASIALPEAGVGVVPGWSGTQRLARLLPEPVLKEMALFGRRIGADRALGLGFAAEVAADARTTARAIADNLQRLSPRSVEAAKWMIHAARGEDAAAATEALASAAIAATEDRTEGTAAFRAKRPAHFTGG